MMGLDLNDKEEVDMWIVKAKIEELQLVKQALESFREHYGQGGVEGAYYKEEAIAEFIRVLRRQIASRWETYRKLEKEYMEAMGVAKAG